MNWRKLIGLDRKPVSNTKRRYEAAHPSRIAGGFGIAPQASMNERLRGDLRGLVAHCRQQSENNDYLKAYLDMVERHVIGPDGIRLQAEAKNDNGQLDKPANAQIETAWKKWGRFGNPTVDGCHTWKSAQDLIARSTARDGNVFLRQFRGANFGEFGYRLQILEMEHLDLDMNQTMNNGSRIVMGIEIDQFQKVVAYNMFRQHPGDSRAGVERDRVRIPADQIIHVFRSERPGQALGIPWTYTALRRLNLLRGWEEASMTAARAGASKMGFFEQDAEEDLDPDEIDESETENGHLIENMDPGIVETLPPGVRFNGFDPGYPNGEMEPFMKLMLRGGAAGLGVAYSSLANDLEGANFSSLRSGLGEERDQWRMEQRFFSDHVNDRVYLSWLRMAMGVGAINLPFRKLEKFSDVRWRPRGWQAVNPAQEATANDKELQANLTSPQEIVARRGQSLDEVYEQIAAAKQLLAEHGLTPEDVAVADLAGEPVT